MIERDYVLRMIQQLATVVAKVLLHRDLGQYGEGQHEIDEAGERFVGAKWSFLRTLTDLQLIELLGYERHPDKLLAAAELLRAESELLDRQGRLDESVNQGIKAFSLFAELLIRENGYLTLITTEKIDALLRRLDLYELPVALREKEFRYHEVSRQFAQAEDVLYELIDQDGRFRNVAQQFYERILMLSDEELQSGGLSRQHAKNRLAELHREGT